MRRLKTLNRDVFARREVGLASKQNQSGDLMDFGLMCFERGRLAAQARESSVIAAEAFVIKMAKKLDVAWGGPSLDADWMSGRTAVIQAVNEVSKALALLATAKRGGK